MRDTVRTQLKSLRKAETHKEKAREKTKKRLSFTANLYKFARNLLDKNGQAYSKQWKRLKNTFTRHILIEKTP